MIKLIKKLFSKNNASKRESDPSLFELHKNFINELLYDINFEWDKMELHFEYYPYPPSYNDKGNFEIYVVKFYTGNDSRSDITLPLEANDALIEIHNEMSKNNKEPWTWVNFTLDNTGKYDFQFNYGVPPHVKERLKNK